ncbi:hypothetical protein TNCV_3395521 [Trichonephila clavipes]|nr:hypothetical protein TNCV_3395521 [Trichonephila clavipes]
MLMFLLICHQIDSNIGSRSTKFLAAKGKIFTLAVIFSFEHNAGGSTIWLGSTPILRENTLGVAKSLPPLWPFHQPHERTCGSTAIRVSPSREKALYIYKHPCLLRYSNPGTTSPQSASLTTIPDGWPELMIKSNENKIE